MLKTLGGDRLGAGKKMKVELHNYERSTHDLVYMVIIAIQAIDINIIPISIIRFPF